MAAALEENSALSVFAACAKLLEGKGAFPPPSIDLANICVIGVKSFSPFSTMKLEAQLGVAIVIHCGILWRRPASLPRHGHSLHRVPAAVAPGLKRWQGQL